MHGDWDNLRFFLEVSRSGNLAAAAQKLQVNHTTVGRRIAALEQSLNTILFRRTPRGFLLTPTGAKLVEYAESLESTFLNIQSHVAGRNLELSGTIRIGTTEGFGSAFLAPRLSPFRERHPNLEIDLVSLAGFVSLSRREAHMAVTYSRPTSGRLVARRLTGYSIRLYAAPHYLDRQAPIRTRADLERADLIGFVDDLIYAPELRFIHRIVSPQRVRLRSNSIVAQHAMAVSGAGIAALPTFVAAADERLVPVLPDEVVLPRELYLVTHADLVDLERMIAVRSFLVSLVEENQPLMQGVP